ncbi:MAG: HAMP domain-containing histidine kinase [Spirochaetaceae bacterium]|nr:HAMP domain-containing histidine kinase [Spirochaetaceae bacterium]
MKMIKRLQVKIIIAVMGVLTLVLSGIFFSINTLLSNFESRQSKVILENLAVNDGKKMSFSIERQYFFKQDKPPEPDENIFENNEKLNDSNEDAKGERRDSGFVFSLYNITRSMPYDLQTVRNYFSVKISDAGEIYEILSPFPVHFTETEIINLVSSVFLLKKTSGNFQGLRYLLAKKNYGFIMVFLDRRTEDNLRFQLLQISLVVYLVCIIAGTLIAFFFSLWAVIPVKTAFTKQKQFIADASHELKTPLAVINANVDVLEGEIGRNTWLDYIKSESSRMNSLVKDLLLLAKYDSKENIYEFTEFDLSRALMSTALPFETLVYEQGKKMSIDIPDSILFKGDENRIKQLLLILLDNALKNSNESDEVSLKLEISGSKKIITVYNTGTGLDNKECEKIFERFYRADSSRTRETGGYGLGLAIAKTITEAHKGKIFAEGKKESWAKFTIIL